MENVFDIYFCHCYNYIIIKCVLNLFLFLLKSIYLIKLYIFNRLITVVFLTIVF